jgi:hypothetical protein
MYTWFKHDSEAKYYRRYGGWGCSSMLECLSVMCESLDLIPGTAKTKINQKNKMTIKAKDNTVEQKHLQVVKRQAMQILEWQCLSRCVSQ